MNRIKYIFYLFKGYKVCVCIEQNLWNKNTRKLCYTKNVSWKLEIEMHHFVVSTVLVLCWIYSNWWNKNAIKLCFYQNFLLEVRDINASFCCQPFFYAVINSFWTFKPSKLYLSLKWSICITASKDFLFHIVSKVLAF